MPNSYLEEILNKQAQQKVVGRGGLTPSQIEAAFEGDIAARYKAVDTSRRTTLAENTETARESEFAQSLDITKQQLKQQQMSSIVGGAINVAGAIPSIMKGVSTVGSWLKPGVAATTAGTTGGAITSEAAGSLAAEGGATFAGAGGSTVAPLAADEFAATGVEAGTAAGGGAALGGVFGAATLIWQGFKGAVLGGKGPTIVCTEMYRQGRINSTTRRAASRYSAFVSSNLYEGYLTLFSPWVRLSHRSRLAACSLAFLGVPFSREVAHRVNHRIPGSVFGSIIIAFFTPICLTVQLFKKRGNVPCQSQQHSQE